MSKIRKRTHTHKLKEKQGILCTLDSHNNEQVQSGQPSHDANVWMIIQFSSCLLTCKLNSPEANYVERNNKKLNKNIK
jgi:hypothetical protein